MTDDGEALDAPVQDDAGADEDQHEETPQAGPHWHEALVAELHSRAMASMNFCTIMCDLGLQ